LTGVRQKARMSRDHNGHLDEKVDDSIAPPVAVGMPIL
jgi:hypothetical protein